MIDKSVLTFKTFPFISALKVFGRQQYEEMIPYLLHVVNSDEHLVPAFRYLREDIDIYSSSFNSKAAFTNSPSFIRETLANGTEKVSSAYKNMCL